ncbi:hypothetical protein ACIPLC_26635 [Kitasatospora sp. NPDC086801]|uniref:hypothetical protein n=1 Tax=Kitasatospora sp. NPDC086801 TaxID=3364066 RepID=UPI0038043B72
MTADRRPMWQPFSEPSADQPPSEERERLLPVERSLFQEPPTPDPDLPRQPAADARRLLGPGGLTFTEAG